MQAVEAEVHLFQGKVGDSLSGHENGLCIWWTKVGHIHLDLCRSGRLLGLGLVMLLVMQTG